MLDSAIGREIIMRIIKYALKQLKQFMSSDDFKLTVDQVIDRVEDHFKDGSTKDRMAEFVCKELRDYFNIPDND